MSKALPTKNIAHSLPDCNYTAITIAFIITVGICYCANITVNAKYDWSLELKCDKLSLKTQGTPMGSTQP